MPKVKLTEKALAKIKAPDPSGRQVLHWDTELKGFGVLASGTTNSRTYIVQRDLPNGRSRRVTVGAVNEISLDKARDRAADMLDDLRRGIDPKRKIVNLTLQAALDTYLAARKDLRPASIKAYRGSVEGYLSSWLEWSLRDITSEMVEERHSEIAKEIADGERYTGTITANLAMRTLRILWNFAAERIPDLPPNPVRLRRQWFPEPRRERLVRADELPKFYQAVCALPNLVARDFLLLLLFTGLRLGESRSLRWVDIDLSARMIRLPASSTKGSRKLNLPMSDFVRDMLVARRALGDGNYVFPGPGKAGYIMDAQFPLAAVAKASGIRVSAHDLRRTFITVAASTPGISPLALKALVNHSIGKDVTAGYVMLTDDDLRAPVQLVANRLKELCAIPAPAGENVAKLGG